MSEAIIFAAGNERGGAATHLLGLARVIHETNPPMTFRFLFVGTGPLTEAFASRHYAYDTLNGSPVRVIQALVCALRKVPAGSVLHAHGPRLNLMAAIACGRTRAPWVSTLHSNPQLDFMASRWKSLILPRLNVGALKRASGVFVVNPVFAKLLPGVRTVWVPNGVYLQAPKAAKETSRQALRDKLSVPVDVPLIGVAARLDPVKRVETILMAAAESPWNPHVAIAGEGPERARWMALADQMGISERVHFMGYIEDVAPFYAGLDIHVMASESEGMPSAVLEAGNAGTLNIGTDIPGIAQIITHEQTGLTFPVGDVHALVKALDVALSRPGKTEAMVQRFATEVLPKFTPQKMLEHYLDGYRQFTGFGRQVNTTF